MATSNPPLWRETTFPSTGIFAAQAARSSALARRPEASFLEIRISGPALTTTASIRSPTFAPSSSWMSMSASDLPPMATRTKSWVTPAIWPETRSPSWGFLVPWNSAARAASKA